MPAGRGELLPHSDRYRLSLDEGWEDLQDWLRSSGLACSYLKRSVSRWAAVLPRYVRDRYAQRASRLTVTYALLAVQRRLHASRIQLKDAWELAWEWRSRNPPVVTTPLPPAIAEAVLELTFALAVRQPTFAARRLWFCALAVMWTGYETLMRPCEMAAISAASTVFSDQLGEDDIYAVCTIPNSKNRKAFALQQFVLVERRAIVTLLRWLCDSSAPSKALFTANRARLQAILQSVLACLGIPAGTFTLRSFRPGRATQLFREERNVAALQFTGRWGTPKTLHHYLQEATAALVMARLSPTAQASVAEARGLFRDMEAAFRSGIPTRIRSRLRC